MPDDAMVFNGINGDTGGYLTPNLTPAQVSKMAQGEKLDPAHFQDLERRAEAKDFKTLGVVAGVDATDLGQAGWGVIFAHEDAGRVDALKEALGGLLERRKAQAGQYYYEYTGPKAYRPGESKNKWLARNGAGPGAANPKKVPYYLLIVGSPAVIPFRFQYQLDVDYAVGRICFDTLEEYALYAQSVVAAEKGEVRLPRRAAFFGVQNKADQATQSSATQLVKPVAKEVGQGHAAWTVDMLVKDQAYKKDLSQILHGDQPPAFLFTASHGMGFAKGQPRQRPHQGALLCQDWPGPLQWKEPIPEAHYFSADDVAADAKIHGMIGFFFACYGGGTPLLDDFAHSAFQERVEIADKPFVARLPEKLLSHPQGGALAVVAHVERAWGYSFMWPMAGPQFDSFQSTFEDLLAGHPVGNAMEYFNDKFATLSVDLNAVLEDVKFGGKPDDNELTRMWTATNDARSYIIVGDPAVRLAV